MPIPAIVGAILNLVASKALSQQEDPAVREIAGIGMSKINSNVRQVGPDGNPIQDQTTPTSAPSTSASGAVSSLYNSSMADDYQRRMGEYMNMRDKRYG